MLTCKRSELMHFSNIYRSSLSFRSIHVSSSSPPGFLPLSASNPHKSKRGFVSYICHTNTYTGILIQKLFSAAFGVSMLRALLCYFQVKTEAALGFMKFLFWFQSLPQFTVGLAQATADLRNQMKRYIECYMICFRLYCMLLFVMVLWILSPLFHTRWSEQCSECNGECRECKRNFSGGS